MAIKRRHVACDWLVHIITQHNQVVTESNSAPGVNPRWIIIWGCSQYIDQSSV